MNYDPREGSGEGYLTELLPHLKRLKLPLYRVRLNSADFAWEGDGPEGAIKVGVEFKMVHDLCSSIREGRLRKQVAKMVQDYDRCYLLIQGLYCTDKDDRVLFWNDKQSYWPELKLGGSRPLRFSEIDGFLNSMAECAGFRIRTSVNTTTSAAMLADLFRHTRKPFNEHKALGEGGIGGSVQYKSLAQKIADSAAVGKQRLVKPSLTWGYARQLGLGDKQARAVAKFFPSAEDMVRAEPEEWAQIPGISLKRGKEFSRRNKEIK